jgi:hypothetical protein
MADRETIDTLSLRVKALEDMTSRELARSISDRAELFEAVKNSQEDRQVLHDTLDAVAENKPTEISIHALVKTIPAPIIAIIIGTLISIGTLETSEYFTVQAHSKLLDEYEIIRKDRERQFNQIAEKMGRIEERLNSLLELWRPDYNPQHDLPRK